MPEPPNFKDIFDELLADLEKHGREGIQQYLDLHKVYIEAQREFVDKELSKDNETLKHLVRMVMQSCLQATQVSREQRTRVNDIHGTLVKAHLEFIDHLKETLDKDPKDPKPTKPPTKRKGRGA